MRKAYTKAVRQLLAYTCFRGAGQPARERGVWPLYGAAFWMSLALNGLWTAMPFVIRNIGGTKEHVGYSWAAYMCGYLFCLLFTATKLGHLNPRRTTRAAAATMCLAACVMLAVVYHAIASDQVGRPGLIWTVIAAGTVVGGSMSLYWPYLMAWVSSDYEGAALNRRLGTYNGMWSSAGIIGPALGGILVGWSTAGPVALAVASLASCFLLLCVAHDKSAGTAASAESVDTPEVYFDERLLLSLRWMARIGLFCSWFSMAVSRSQFALLFTDMGFTEGQFGMLAMTFGICNFLVLTGAGRAEFWHFRASLFAAVQVALASSVLLLIFGRTLWAFAPSFVIMGCAFGFAFSSHLYYGACGSKKRSRQMAIHEVTISLGVIIGSATGGYLADNFGVYHPYWFALTVLAVGMTAQAAVWALVGRKPPTKTRQ